MSITQLQAAGHKVGVVRQIETAALKKVGDNRNAPSTRKLTNVYTKGTYVDEIGELDQQGDNSGAPAAGYLLCITESKAKGWGTDEKVDVGIIAVQPATGDIIYDSFEDGFMRNEIETRLLHISPCEFLIVGELTKATDKLIQHLSGSSTNVFGDKSRVERVPVREERLDGYRPERSGICVLLRRTPQRMLQQTAMRALKHHLCNPSRRSENMVVDVGNTEAVQHATVNGYLELSFR